MDSLLHIETKKQKLRQTVKDFNFHSVRLLSQAPLVCGSSALPSPCSSPSLCFSLYIIFTFPFLFSFFIFPVNFIFFCAFLCPLLIAFYFLFRYFYTKKGITVEFLLTDTPRKLLNTSSQRTKLNPQILYPPINIMRLESLKEDNLYTGNKPLEFILVPKCPLFRDSTVYE